MTLKINYHFDCEAIALNYILAKKRRKYRLIYVLAIIDQKISGINRINQKLIEN